MRSFKEKKLSVSYECYTISIIIVISVMKRWEHKWKIIFIHKIESIYMRKSNGRTKNEKKQTNKKVKNTNQIYNIICRKRMIDEKH